MRGQETTYDIENPLWQIQENNITQITKQVTKLNLDTGSFKICTEISHRNRIKSDFVTLNICNDWKYNNG